MKTLTNRDLFTLMFVLIGAVITVFGYTRFNPPNTVFMWAGIATMLISAIVPNITKKINWIEMIGRLATLSIILGFAAVILASKMYNDTTTNWEAVMGFGVISIVVGWPILGIAYYLKTRNKT